MLNALASYCLAFALSIPSWWPHSAHRMTEMIEIARDIGSTDAGPIEGLELMNIAALESGFDTHARGRAGERGAFQVMPPAASYGAHEALSRLRRQGLRGFMGFVVCGQRCLDMAERRTFPAKLYFWSHPYSFEPSGGTDNE